MRCNVTVLERQGFDTCSCRGHNCCILFVLSYKRRSRYCCLSCSACLASQLHTAEANTGIYKRELSACLWMWKALCRGDILSERRKAAGCSFGGLLACTGRHTVLPALLAR